MKPLIAVALLGLAACGQPKPVVLQPPPALLSCKDEPTPPTLPEQDWTAAIEIIKEVQLIRDELTLDYILKQRSAWGDCRSKVDGVRAWSAEVNRGQ